MLTLYWNVAAVWAGWALGYMMAEAPRSESPRARLAEAVVAGVFGAAWPLVLLAVLGIACRRHILRLP